MNLFTKQKQTHRHREHGCQGGRIGGRDSQRVWDGHVYTAICKMDKQPGIVQGTLLNIMWQLGWEGYLGENRYMYMSD